MIKILICIVVALGALPLVYGHKINMLAQVEGSSILTQVYFSDGTPAKNCVIEIYGPTNKKISEGKTGDNGEFSFPITARTDLKIIADAGMGHRAETVIRASDLPPLRIDTKPAGKTPIAAIEPRTIDKDTLRTILAEILDEKLQPIATRVSRLEKRHVSVTEIIGGIGYIFGLMGLFMYFRRRK